MLSQLQRHESMTLRDLAEQIAVTDQETDLGSMCEEAVTEVEVALHHVHAPKLAEAGYVDYDARRQLVALTGSGRRVQVDTECDAGRIEPSETVTVELGIETIEKLHEAITRDERLSARMRYDEIIGTLLADADPGTDPREDETEAR
uniref:DUF7344 domain-containing protein n=1 Tax=Salinigranum salinum TaxID=1364937 RepID=UPI001260E548|nr:hypothetical protein [Salinigranum salinum]